MGDHGAGEAGWNPHLYAFPDQLFPWKAILPLDVHFLKIKVCIFVIFCLQQKNSSGTIKKIRLKRK